MYFKKIYRKYILTVNLKQKKKMADSDSSLKNALEMPYLTVLKNNKTKTKRKNYELVIYYCFHFQLQTHFCFYIHNYFHTHFQLQK